LKFIDNAINVCVLITVLLPIKNTKIIEKEQRKAVMNDLVSIGDILELCHKEIHKIEDIKLRAGYLLALVELCTRCGRNPEMWTKPEILKKACEYARVDLLGLVNIFHSVFVELAKKKGLLGENQKAV
jgi:hypothetical protein